MLMNIRHLSASFAVAAAIVAGAAPAQQQTPVAKLANVAGNVLVTRGNALVGGADGQRLTVGTRVVTTAGAMVTINYDVGCDISLKENQRFTVRQGECAVLLAEVERLGPTPGAIGGGLGVDTSVGATAGLTAAGVIGGIGIIGVGAYEAFKKQPVSPN